MYSASCSYQVGPIFSDMENISPPQDASKRKSSLSNRRNRNKTIRSNSNGLEPKVLTNPYVRTFTHPPLGVPTPTLVVNNPAPSQEIAKRKSPPGDRDCEGSGSKKPRGGEIEGSQRNKRSKEKTRTTLTVKYELHCLYCQQDISNGMHSCKKNFSWKKLNKDRAMYKHIIKRHFEVQNIKKKRQNLEFQCNVCGCCFPEEKSRDLHVESHDNPTLCPTCQTDLLTAEQLEFHQAVKHFEVEDFLAIAEVNPSGEQKEDAFMAFFDLVPRKEDEKHFRAPCKVEIECTCCKDNPKVQLDRGQARTDATTPR